MRSTLSNLVDHKAGIHTGRKEAANLNIGNLVGGNAFGKGIGDDFSHSSRLLESSTWYLIS